MHPILKRFVGLSLAALLVACHSPGILPGSSALNPPVAKKIPTSREFHGKVLHDDYLWLRDTSYPEVNDPDILAYLEAENRWFDQQMKPLQPAVDTLFEEMKGRVEEDQESVPWVDGDYIYRWRYLEGSQYRLWERQPLSGGAFVTLLDESAEASGHDYFRLTDLEVSPDGALLAWSADINGSERSRLFVDDLNTGHRYDDDLENVNGKLVWGSDSRTVFYTPVEADGWYSLRVKAHRVGSPVASDREVFYQPDRTLFLTISRSQSRKYLFITLEDHESSEQRILSLDDPGKGPQLVAPRRDGHYYDMDHANGKFYIRTNDQHVNFRIATAPEATPGQEHWQTLLPPSDDVYYQRFVLLQDFIAVEEMSEGLKRIRIRENDGRQYHVSFPEDVYAASLGENPQLASDYLRIDYESMVTPRSVYDYRPADGSLALRQRQRIPSGYDSDQFRTERLWATARDGTRVPVSLVYRRDTPRDGTAPLFLYGYGAYGIGEAPGFSTTELSLLNRGVIYAIAHVRGGDEMGYQWYLDGKLDKRTNTFNDFIDVARYLVAQDYTRAGRIAISGGSAGGELVGAAVVQAPELWAAAILDVPFVDVLNTMLDDSLPLTPPEWPEWGNPIADPAAFDLIRGYSPYDNIVARDYPAMLVTGGLNDPRVTYWEPAKWTAKMRALKTDDNELLLKINMGAGHGGPSGRYSRLYEYAEAYAFALSHLGVPVH